MRRYRIYKVLKWFFAVSALSVLLFTWMRTVFMPDLQVQQEYLVSIVYAVLAIFFKLQEDSNKPTEE